MLTWNDLSPARQKWVRLVQMHYPEITETITFKQIKEIHEHFLSLREEDKRYKVSYALWLIGNNAISRGVYFFPAEENTPPEKESSVVDDKLELEYKKELELYGI